MTRIPRGFTLIEMMITLAIIALLATVATPVMQLSIKRAKEQELTRALNAMRDAIDAYKDAVEDGRITKNVGESGYPKSLAVLVLGVENQQDPKRGKLVFLRQLPRDPFCKEVETSSCQAWGQRAYVSPAEAPQAGEDVYDVYSLAPGVGLNGVPYRQW